MVGRDIGTVVLPEADLKIFLVASAEERARRRCREKLDHGESANYPEILAAIQERDQFDSNREHSPLRAAPDALILDTDQLNIHQAFEQVWGLVLEKAAQDLV